MKVPVYKINGKKSTKDIDLPKAVFDIEPNDNAIYQAILAERANRRQGTHKVKVRSEVRGGGKKPWRQKGTGRARIGTSRAPHWRGGGVVFGPHNRDHSMKLNKKVKRLARISAFSQKYREKKLQVIENFSLEEPKTKKIYEILKSLDLSDKKTALLVEKCDENLLKSSRNISNFIVHEIDKASTFHILDCEVLLVQESAVNLLKKALN